PGPVWRLSLSAASCRSLKDDGGPLPIAPEGCPPCPLGPHQERDMGTRGTSPCLPSRDCDSARVVARTERDLPSKSGEILGNLSKTETEDLWCRRDFVFGYAYRVVFELDDLETLV